jgi:hypothetical protein
MYLKVFSNKCTDVFLNRLDFVRQFKKLIVIVFLYMTSRKENRNLLDTVSLNSKGMRHIYRLFLNSSNILSAVCNFPNK